MRKYIFSLLGTMVSMVAFAQDYDEVGIVPTDLTAGEKGSITLTLSNPGMDNVIGMQFDIVVPDGWTIAKSATSFGARVPTDDLDDSLYTLTGYYHSDGGFTRYLLYNTSNIGLGGNSGNVVDIAIKAPEGTADGYYPITVKNVVLSNSITASDNINIDETTSYVRVGNPENATLALTGIVPTFVNEALALETSATLATLDLTAATAINGTFHYVDARNVVVAESNRPTLSKVSFKREVSDDKYITVNLPFDATFTHYKVTGNTDNIVNFTEEQTYTKDTPALVLGSVTASAENVELAGVAKQTITDGYYVKDNMLWKVNEYANISALRGYFPSGIFTFNDAASSSMRIIINNGTTTGIESIVDDNENPTYDLQGRRTVQKASGIYIRKGEKVIIK